MKSFTFVVIVGILIVLGSADKDHCAARGLHQCTLTPEQIEGPYFIFNGIPYRSDIKEDRVGVPLGVDLVFQDTNNCAPVKGLMVHLWSADALGVYSGFTTVQDKHFLRGYQVTNDNGTVHFDLIIPGWYTGRCNHIHIETFLPPEMGGNNQTIHTTQGYFPDELAMRLRNMSVYIDNPNGVILNEQDNVFLGQQGANLIMDVQPASQNLDIDGYAAKMVIGIHLQNAANSLNGNLVALIMLVILIRTLSTKFY